MRISAEEKEFVAYVVELMQSIGPVRAKAMFGGHGIFLEDLMFGLVAGSVLFLKADKESESNFKVRELEAFTYVKNGKEFKMSYYQAPEEVLEEGEAMSYWGSMAYSAALRAASKKQKTHIKPNITS
jgi:DNA transformation protein